MTPNVIGIRAARLTAAGKRNAAEFLGVYHYGTSRWPDKRFDLVAASRCFLEG
jgi:hypothetical protein